MAEVQAIQQGEISPEEMRAVKAWWTEIQLAQKEKFFERWLKRGKKIEKRFRDEREFSILEDTFNNKRFNILWSNTNTLAPALYSRTPKPQVERRFKDNDPVGRAASQMLERALQYTIQSYDFDHTLVHCRDDFLLPGRGQVWIEYKPQFGPMLDEMGQRVLDENGKPAERVVFEEVCANYLHWEDFLHNPARVWDEVRWVAKRAYMTRDEIQQRFGEDKASKVSLDYLPEELEQRDMEKDVTQERYKKAIVWELWDKPTKKVYWVAKGWPGFLDQKDDILNLKNFFPCPRPCIS